MRLPCRATRLIGAITVIGLVATACGPAAKHPGPSPASLPASAPTSRADETSGAGVAVGLPAPRTGEAGPGASDPVGLVAAQAAVVASSGLEFDAPSALAASAGHLWVANYNGNSVTEINPANGAWLRTVRGTGYYFNHPTSIASNGADLFVANAAGFVTEMRSTDGAAVRVISGAQYGFDDPVAITYVAGIVVTLNAVGTVTEFNSSTGAFVRRLGGARFAMVKPVALTASGNDVFVADKGNHSVTEFNAVNGGLVRVITSTVLDAPGGVAAGAGHVWVTDSASNAATEIDAANGHILATVNSSAYGFGQPSVAISSGGNVFITTPNGVSPMVTKMSATTGAAAWFMCNTNGPYYFSSLTALAVSGSGLWVASRTGANSKTAGAKYGSLTELSTGSGGLIRTLPSH